MTIPRRVLWSVPLLLTLHNAEEALTMRRALPVVRERAPEALRPLLAAVSYPVFVWALVLATLVPLALTVWADRQPASAPARWAVVLVQAVVALNVVWHVVTAVVFGGYVPGLVTAVLVNAPFSVYFFRRAARERWLRPAALWATVPAAVTVHGPGLFGFYALACSLSCR